MNILIVNCSNFGIAGMQKAFKNLSVGYKIINRELQTVRSDPKVELDLMEAIAEASYDAVFSFNFLPVLATACYKLHKKYFCWVYDNPQVKLYSTTMLYPTNYCFLFDRAEYETLRDGGIGGVYHLPLAADVNTYSAIDYSKAKPDHYNDISFIGKMYNEDDAYLSRYKNMEPYYKGYVDGILRAQNVLYQQNILEEALSPGLIDELYRLVPYKPTDDGVETLQYIFANYYLARKLATFDRHFYLEELSKHFRVSLYTLEKTPELPRVINKGIAVYDKDMPLVFNHSKINLNIGLRSIKTGISLRCFDIMGCGGFLMSTCQNELWDYFVPGEDFEFFTSPEDLVKKCKYYLDHDDVREKVARNGLEKVREFHSFECRIKEMFDIVFA